jgi:hypothetical protein
MGDNCLSFEEFKFRIVSENEVSGSMVPLFSTVKYVIFEFAAPIFLFKIASEQFIDFGIIPCFNGRIIIRFFLSLIYVNLK